MKCEFPTRPVTIPGRAVHDPAAAVVAAAAVTTAATACFLRFLPRQLFPRVRESIREINLDRRKHRSELPRADAGKVETKSRAEKEADRGGGGGGGEPSQDSPAAAMETSRLKAAQSYRRKRLL